MFDEMNPEKDEIEELLNKAFSLAGLPEIAESDVEENTYTNAAMIEKLRSNPLKLVKLLQDLAKMNIDIKRKRALLSRAVDISMEL